jgi:hypothetical protein
MANPTTYTALLYDNPFGPVVERAEGLRLVDGRPDPVMRRYAERSGRRWVRVYALDDRESGSHDHSYILMFEALEPAPDADGSGKGTMDGR